MVDERSPKGVGDDRSDAALVTAVRDGDRDAFAVLFSRWFDRVYDVARNIVRSPETAADVAQDTFIAAWERLDRLEQVDSFGGWLLRIARNRALDRLERDDRSRPHQGDTVSDLFDAGARSPVAAGRAADPGDIAAATDRDGLIAAAAVALGERDASLLDLQLRHGLTPAEIADELGVTANNARQLLFRLRNRLGTAIGAYVLWHRGRPRCPELAALVGGEFDAASVTVIERHRGRCDDCRRRRAALVAPEQLFSAAPVLIAPITLRDRVTDALARAGVPAHPQSEPGAPPDPSPWRAPPDPSPWRAPADPSPWRAPADPSPWRAPTTAEDAADVDERPESASRNRTVLLVAALLVLLIGGATVALARGGSAEDTEGELAFDQTPTVATTAPPPPTLARSGSTTTRPGVVEAAAPTSVGDLTSMTTSTTSTSVPGQPPLVVATQPPAAAPARTSPPVVAPTALPTTAPPPETLPSTAPPAVDTTVPPVAPPTTLPPPPPPPPPVPDVVRFWLGSSPPGVLCANPSQSPRRIQWTSTDATAATLTVHGVTRTVPASGQYDACAATGATASLTVTGPGGGDSASLTV